MVRLELIRRFQLTRFLDPKVFVVPCKLSSIQWRKKNLMTVIGYWGYKPIAVPCSLCAWRSALGRAPLYFTAHEFDGSRVQTPEADTVNQAVHRSGVGKFVAISKQWETAIGDCEDKACGCTMAGVWTKQPEAQTTTCWFPAVRTGDWAIA
jgi:hypothetical protein